jgi:regulation of enolase protein 1 (concanavalin A-like superfamily)
MKKEEKAKSPIGNCTRIFNRRLPSAASSQSRDEPAPTKSHRLKPLFLLFSFFLVACSSKDLPSPWQSQDIGAISVPGNASELKGVFILSGTLDIWGTSDGCHYTWQKLEGDGTIIARVLSVEKTQNHAKGGLAIRESFESGSRHATLVVTPTDGTQFLSRVKESGVTTSQKTGLNKGAMPYWLKLVRHGNNLTGFESTNGKDWTQTGTISIPFPENLFIGLVASSHQKDKLCAVAFDHVSLNLPSK